MWTDEGSVYQRIKGLWVTRAKHHLSLSSTPLLSFPPLILICLFLCEEQIKVPDSACVSDRERLGEYVWVKGWLCVLLFPHAPVLILFNFLLPLFFLCPVLLFCFVSLIRCFVVLHVLCCFYSQSFLIHLWKYELLISPPLYILLFTNTCLCSLFHLHTNVLLWNPISSPLSSHWQKKTPCLFHTALVLLLLLSLSHFMPDFQSKLALLVRSVFVRVHTYICLYIILFYSPKKKYLNLLYYLKKTLGSLDISDNIVLY